MPRNLRCSAAVTPRGAEWTGRRKEETRDSPFSGNDVGFIETQLGRSRHAFFFEIPASYPRPFKRMGKLSFNTLIPWAKHQSKCWRFFTQEPQSIQLEENKLLREKRPSTQPPFHKDRKQAVPTSLVTDGAGSWNLAARHCLLDNTV